MFPEVKKLYNLSMLDRQKAQEFRLLLKKGSTDEALALARGLLRECMVQENLEDACQALILMSSILESNGKSRIIEKEAQRLRALAIRKNSLRPYMGLVHARFVTFLEQVK